VEIQIVYQKYSNVRLEIGAEMAVKILSANKCHSFILILILIFNQNIKRKKKRNKSNLRVSSSNNNCNFFRVISLLSAIYIIYYCGMQLFVRIEY
jgi:hypothetical protein